jgi:hypothetical protein
MPLLMRTIRCLLLLILISNQGSSQSTYKVNGRVIDFDTRQPLKNASITNRHTKEGTVTSDSGYFSLSTRVPDLLIFISSVGYVTVSRDIHLLLDNKPFVVELKRKADEQLDSVVVNAYKNDTKVKSVQMNIVTINPEAIKRAPLLFGEADIIKALVLQPGVTTTGEGAGGYNVRGGNADQNLVLLDGAPLFNTSHLLGFYTSVSPDVVEDITLYKGGMPATHGGRLASLLDMNIKNGYQDRMKYTGGVGPMSARFFVDGPLVKNKLSLTGGARVAYPNPILNQLEGDFGNSRAFFYDAIVKLGFVFNKNNILSVTGYKSYDRFKFDTVNGYEWQTNLVSLNYNSFFNSKLSFKLNANYSQFISTIENLVKYYEFELESSITNTQVKPIFIYRPNKKHKIEVGADYILYGISPGTRTPTSDSSNMNPLHIQKEQGREMSFFLSDEIEFSPVVSLQLGLRYAVYDYLGPKTVYVYEEGEPLSKETIIDSIQYGKDEKIQRYKGLEPRISLKISLKKDLALKFSYNRGQQFLHLISNTTAISPVDFWKLSDPFVKQQIGDQYSTGLFKNFKNNVYEASVEVYYKTTKNIVQYKDGALLLQNPYIETALLNQQGRAYGIEFSVSKNIGKVTGQVNYTYSKAEGQVNANFPEEVVNEGNYYPSENDRPHNLAILTKIKLGRGWSFSTNFVFTSGRPATYPDGNYVMNGTVVTNYSKRNLDRLPAYHRLDAGFTWISKRFPEQRRYSLWNISFYNLYMHENVYSVFFRREQRRLNSYQLSVVGGLIPSVTWNYNF